MLDQINCVDDSPPSSDKGYSTFNVSTILPNFLYLGPELTSPEHVEELRDLGVKRILNIAAECDYDHGLGHQRMTKYVCTFLVFISRATLKLMNLLRYCYIGLTTMHMYCCFHHLVSWLMYLLNYLILAVTRALHGMRHKHAGDSRYEYIQVGSSI